VTLELLIRTVSLICGVVAPDAINIAPPRGDVSFFGCSIPRTAGDVAQGCDPIALAALRITPRGCDVSLIRLFISQHGGVIALIRIVVAPCACEVPFVAGRGGAVG
jgi:hypothetical protein